VPSAGVILYDVVPLADLLDDRWAILRERVEECLDGFMCSRSTHLQEFARNRVKEYEQDGHSRTYVLITPTEDSIDVAAFFTVGMTQLDLSQAGGSAKKKLLGHFSHSRTGAYSLAELARDDRYTSAQLPGKVILDEAFTMVRNARKFIGGRFLVVDARDVVMEKLYKPAGFRVVGIAEPPKGMEEVNFQTACCLILDSPE
jgi:hypothetical protein